MSALPVFAFQCPDPVATFGEVSFPAEAVFLLGPAFRGTKRADLTLTPRPEAAPRAVGDLGPVPGSEATPPLASAAAHAYLRDRLPSQGSVEPVPPGHAAFAKLFAAARAAMVSWPPPNFGTNTPAEAASIVAHHNAEIGRAYRIGESFTFAAVRETTPPELVSDEEIKAIVAAAMLQGITPAGCLAAPLVAQAERAAADAQNAHNAAAANLRLLHEKIEIDLAAHDYALVHGDGPAKLYALNCFPAGDFESLALTTPNGDDVFVPTGVRASVRCSGTATVTRAMLAAVEKLPPNLMRDIATARTANFDPTKVYVSTDFQGDARTPEGREAIEDFTRRARALVPLTLSRATLPGYYAFFSLIVGYGGLVSWSNAVQILTQVCADFAAGGGKMRITVYKATVDSVGMGVRQPDELPPAPPPNMWPRGLPRPHWIIPEMTKVLQHGRSLYAWGELLPRTAAGTVAAVVKRVFRTLEKATKEYAADKDEIRFQAVIDSLHADGLLPSPTVSPADRDKITGALRAAGFEQVERVAEDGQRQRVWVRGASAEKAAE